MANFEGPVDELRFQLRFCWFVDPPEQLRWNARVVGKVVGVSVGPGSGFRPLVGRWGAVGDRLAFYFSKRRGTNGK